MIKRGLVYAAVALGLLVAGVLALGIAANFLVSVVAFWMGLPLLVSAALSVMGGVVLLVGVWVVVKRR